MSTAIGIGIGVSFGTNRVGGVVPPPTFRLLDDNNIDHLMDDNGTTFLMDD